MSGDGNATQRKLINATEGVVDSSVAAELEAHSFRLKPSDFSEGAYPKISAWKSGGLGAIEITLHERVGSNWNPVYKDGAAAVLTATNPQESIISYGTYAVAKADATVGVEVTVTKVR